MVSRQLAVLFVALLLSGCGASSNAVDVTEVFEDLTTSSTVDFVKSGSVEACPYATVGEMANAFMDSPNWTDFVSDQGETVVELQGGISFDGLPATATLQFVVDEAAGTFNTEWLGIDGEGQSLIMMGALLDKMCEATL
jgi:hypothetical protein